VATPAGEALGEPVTLTARVTALTGLGQVLTGGLVLVLLTWWFTHWRNRRRSELASDGRERHPSNGQVQSDAL
jgi:class 3 adenylate cyclase